MTTEDNSILLRLIEGMHNTSHKHKICERLLISNMNFEASITFLQRLGSRRTLVNIYNIPTGLTY